MQSMSNSRWGWRWLILALMILAWVPSVRAWSWFNFSMPTGASQAAVDSYKQQRAALAAIPTKPAQPPAAIPMVLAGWVTAGQTPAKVVVPQNVKLAVSAYNAVAQELAGAWSALSSRIDQANSASNAFNDAVAPTYLGFKVESIIQSAFNDLKAKINGPPTLAELLTVFNTKNASYTTLITAVKTWLAAEAAKLAYPENKPFSPAPVDYTFLAGRSLAADVTGKATVQRAFDDFKAQYKLLTDDTSTVRKPVNDAYAAFDDGKNKLSTLLGQASFSIDEVCQLFNSLTVDSVNKIKTVNAAFAAAKTVLETKRKALNDLLPALVSTTDQKTISDQRAKLGAIPSVPTATTAPLPSVVTDWITTVATIGTPQTVIDAVKSFNTAASTQPASLQKIKDRLKLATDADTALTAQLANTKALSIDLQKALDTFTKALNGDSAKSEKSIADMIKDYNAAYSSLETTRANISKELRTRLKAVVALTPYTTVPQLPAVPADYTGVRTGLSTDAQAALKAFDDLYKTVKDTTASQKTVTDYTAAKTALDALLNQAAVPALDALCTAFVTFKSTFDVATKAVADYKVLVTNLESKRTALTDILQKPAIRNAQTVADVLKAVTAASDVPFGVSRAKELFKSWSDAPAIKNFVSTITTKYADQKASAVELLKFLFDKAPSVTELFDAGTIAGGFSTAMPAADVVTAVFARLPKLLKATDNRIVVVASLVALLTGKTLIDTQKAQLWTIVEPFFAVVTSVATVKDLMTQILALKANLKPADVDAAVAKFTARAQALLPAWDEANATVILGVLDLITTNTTVTTALRSYIQNLRPFVANGLGWEQDVQRIITIACGGDLWQVQSDGSLRTVAGLTKTSSNVRFSGVANKLATVSLKSEDNTKTVVVDASGALVLKSAKTTSDVAEFTPIKTVKDGVETVQFTVITSASTTPQYVGRDRNASDRLTIIQTTKAPFLADYAATKFVVTPLLVAQVAAAKDFAQQLVTAADPSKAIALVFEKIKSIALNGYDDAKANLATMQTIYTVFADYAANWIDAAKLDETGALTPAWDQAAKAFDDAFRKTISYKPAEYYPAQDRYYEPGESLARRVGESLVKTIFGRITSIPAGTVALVASLAGQIEARRKALLAATSNVLGLVTGDKIVLGFNGVGFQQVGVELQSGSTEMGMPLTVRQNSDGSISLALDDGMLLAIGDVIDKFSRKVVFVKTPTTDAAKFKLELVPGQPLPADKQKEGVINLRTSTTAKAEYLGADMWQDGILHAGALEDLGTPLYIKPYVATVAVTTVPTTTGTTQSAVTTAGFSSALQTKLATTPVPTVAEVITFIKGQLTTRGIAAKVARLKTTTRLIESDLTPLVEDFAFLVEAAVATQDYLLKSGSSIRLTTDKNLDPDWSLLLAAFQNDFNQLLDPALKWYKTPNFVYLSDVIISSRADGTDMLRKVYGNSVADASPNTARPVPAILPLFDTARTYLTNLKQQLISDATTANERTALDELKKKLDAAPLINVASITITFISTNGALVGQAVTLLDQYVRATLQSELDKTAQKISGLLDPVIQSIKTLQDNVVVKALTGDNANVVPNLLSFLTEQRRRIIATLQVSGSLKDYIEKADANELPIVITLIGQLACGSTFNLNDMTTWPRRADWATLSDADRTSIIGMLFLLTRGNANAMTPIPAVATDMIKRFVTMIDTTEFFEIELDWFSFLTPDLQDGAAVAKDSTEESLLKNSTQRPILINRWLHAICGAGVQLASAVPANLLRKPELFGTLSADSVTASARAVAKKVTWAQGIINQLQPADTVAMAVITRLCALFSNEQFSLLLADAATTASYSPIFDTYFDQVKAASDVVQNFVDATAKAAAVEQLVSSINTILSQTDSQLGWRAKKFMSSDGADTTAAIREKLLALRDSWSGPTSTVVTGINSSAPLFTQLSQAFNSATAGKVPFDTFFTLVTNAKSAIAALDMAHRFVVLTWLDLVYRNASYQKTTITPAREVFTELFKGLPTDFATLFAAIQTFAQQADSALLLPTSVKFDAPGVRDIYLKLRYTARSLTLEIARSK